MTQAITKFDGTLEIDHARGVIYFHAGSGQGAAPTVLRICSLPKPIPQFDEETFLDVTHMFGANWRAK